MRALDEDLAELETEARNPNTIDIDRLDTEEILRRINEEDRRVATAVEGQIGEIAKAVELVVSALRSGGRLIYVGAGTSGRIAALDAVECPPTFGVDPGQVVAILAGGRRAMWRSVEGAEDNERVARIAVAKANVSPRDVVIGVSASGRSPFVYAALEAARRRGAKVVAVSCVSTPRIAELADVCIAPITGPEVIAGSTRMKAGTAQKMILNMITTAAMIRLGKVYSNLMVELWPMSEKLVWRARKILKEALGVGNAEAQSLYEESGRNLKVAIVMGLAGVGRGRAAEALERCGGVVWRAIEYALGRVEEA